MDSVLRGALVYLFLLMIFRLTGKRSLAEVTTFNFVLMLIIAETTQEAMIDRDHSMTNAMLLILTLVGLELVFSLVKQRWPRLDKLIDDVPLIICEDGRLLRERMDKARVDESDVLSAARELQGLERLDQIKYAVLERNGAISIIPRQSAKE